MKSHSLISVLLITVLMTGCSSSQESPSNEKNNASKSNKPPKAIMLNTEKNKKQSLLYENNYDHGFVGKKALGWDSTLQYARSRVGAAMTCQIPINKPQILINLAKTFGFDVSIHDNNIMNYHYTHSNRIANFCTPERIKEINTMIPHFEAGEFTNPYDSDVKTHTKTASENN